MLPIREDEDNALDRSLERIIKQEEKCADSAGFAVTRQGQAIRRKYEAQLAEIIGTERRRSRRCNNDAWKALRGVENDDLALRLIIAGMNICAGEPVLSKIALSIGRAMGNWDLATTAQ